MSTIQYAVVNVDENWVESPFMKTKKRAKEWWVGTTGEAWDENNYVIQGFDAAARKAVREAPEQ